MPPKKIPPQAQMPKNAQSISQKQEIKTDTKSYNDACSFGPPRRVGNTSQEPTQANLLDKMKNAISSLTHLPKNDFSPKEQKKINSLLLVIGMSMSSLTQEDYITISEVINDINVSTFSFLEFSVLFKRLTFLNFFDVNLNPYQHLNSIYDRFISGFIDLLNYPSDLNSTALMNNFLLGMANCASMHHIKNNENKAEVKTLVTEMFSGKFNAINDMREESYSNLIIMLEMLRQSDVLSKEEAREIILKSEALIKRKIESSNHLSPIAMTACLIKYCEIFKKQASLDKDSIAGMILRKLECGEHKGWFSPSALMSVDFLIIESNNTHLIHDKENNKKLILSCIDNILKSKIKLPNKKAEYLLLNLPNLQYAYPELSEINEVIQHAKQHVMASMLDSDLVASPFLFKFIDNNNTVFTRKEKSKLTEHIISKHVDKDDIDENDTDAIISVTQLNDNSEYFKPFRRKINEKIPDMCRHIGNLQIEKQISFCQLMRHFPSDPILNKTIKKILSEIVVKKDLSLEVRMSLLRVAFKLGSFTPSIPEFIKMANDLYKESLNFHSRMALLDFHGFICAYILTKKENKEYPITGNEEKEKECYRTSLEHGKHHFDHILTMLKEDIYIHDIFIMHLNVSSLFYSGKTITHFIPKLEPALQRLVKNETKQSLSESIVEEYLRSELPEDHIIKEQSINSMPPIDFYLPEIKIIGEVNGPLHFLGADQSHINGFTLLRNSIFIRNGYYIHNMNIPHDVEYDGYKPLCVSLAKEFVEQIKKIKTRRKPVFK